MPRLQPAFAVKINERAKTLEPTADDCDHQRKAERAGAGERLRCTPDSNPNREALLMGTWEDTLPRERRPEASVPSETRGLAEFEKEIQFLGKECIVIPRVEAKQWIGFTERPPANDDLGASLRDEIESGELLKHAHRVCGAQHRNRARKTDRLGAGSGRRKNDCWRRVEKLSAVVFTHAEHVEPNLVGDLDLFKKIGHPISSRWGRTRRWIGEDGCKTVNADFHSWSPTESPATYS